MTLEAFEALPEAKPYLEYICGEVIQKPVPKRPHGKLQAELARRLGNWAVDAGGSVTTEVHTYFPAGTETVVRVPDVLYWAPGKPEGDDQHSLPPTLAVEVRSVTQSWYNQQAKCRFMLAHGVDVCWLVDPEARTAEIYEGDGEPRILSGDAVLESSHLPGFALPIADLFAVLD